MKPLNYILLPFKLRRVSRAFHNECIGWNMPEHQSRLARTKPSKMSGCAIGRQLGVDRMGDVQDDDSDFEVTIGSTRSRKRAKAAAKGERAAVVLSPYFAQPVGGPGIGSQSLNPRKKPVTLKPGRRRVSDMVNACIKEAHLDGAGDRKSLAAIMQTCLEEPSVQGRNLTGTFSSRLKEGHQATRMQLDGGLDIFNDPAGRGSRTVDRTRGPENCMSVNQMSRALSDISNKANVKPTKTRVSRKKKRKFLPDEDVEDSTLQTEPPRVSINMEEVLQILQAEAVHKQIVHIEHLPGRKAKFEDIEYKLSAKLQKALKDRGVSKLYSHQATAVNMICSGSSIVAATPTASGKSMTYLIPVLDSLINVPKSRAIFLFPLKALAQDQLKTLSDLVTKVKRGQPHCYCYDGDTSHADRNKIRKNGRIILTNPDMLHYNILPKHQSWAQFFTNLKFVVLDEAHTYRGVFGSHVGCILRRLLRIVRHYGAEPMFICCSATIANPKEHVKQLTTLDVEAIHGTGAPVGDRHIVCWNPPSTSPYSESANVAISLLQRGLRMLIFVEARKLAEIVCNAIRSKLIEEKCPELAKKVESYRAGYTAEDRRALEKRLQDGSLKALVTTRALELGIDVGCLDATIHVGLPDTMCSLWQQIGRSGRRQGAALSVVVAHQRPNDLFYMKNPQKLFAREMEKAYCNPGNPRLLSMHLCCAANELPLEEKDREYFGDDYEECRDDLAIDGVLRSGLGIKGETVYTYRLTDNPSNKCPIRGTSMDSFQLVNENKQVIEEMETKWAYRRLHLGAIYPHQRESYKIVEFDILAKQAVGVPCHVDYVTEVRDRRTVEVLQDVHNRTVGATQVHFGKVRVREEVVAYTEVDLIRNRPQSLPVPLNLPANIFDTVGFWCDIPEDVRRKLTTQAEMMNDALEALARIMRALLPALTMSEQADMNSLATMEHEDTKNPQIFLYDAYPGGIGLAKQAFDEFIEEIWSRALCVINSCDCKNGCPCCTKTGSSDDKEVQPFNTKQACKTLLDGMLGTWMSSDQKQSSQDTAVNEAKKPQKNGVAAMLERFDEPL